MTESVPRGRPGLGGVAIGLGTLAIGIIGLVVANDVREHAGDPNAQLVAVVTDVSVGLLVVGVVFAFGLFFSLRGLYRNRTLARMFPGATIVTGATSYSLTEVFRRMGRALEVSELPDLPMGFSLVADRHGVAFWGGTPNKPSKRFWLEWPTVSSVTSGWAKSGGNQFRSILISTVIGSETFTLPVIVVGNVMGLGSAAESTVEQWVQDFEHQRISAR